MDSLGSGLNSSDKDGSGSHVTPDFAPLARASNDRERQNPEAAGGREGHGGSCALTPRRLRRAAQRHVGRALPSLRSLRGSREPGGPPAPRQPGGLPCGSPDADLSLRGVQGKPWGSGTETLAGTERGERPSAAGARSLACGPQTCAAQSSSRPAALLTCRSRSGGLRPGHSAGCESVRFRRSAEESAGPGAWSAHTQRSLRHRAPAVAPAPPDPRGW